MEVMVEVSSIPAYVSGTAQDKRKEEEEEEEEGCGGGVVVVGRFSGQSGEGGFLIGSEKRIVGSENPEASSGSSSLGNPSDEEEDDAVSSSGGGDEDVVSAGAGFGSLRSLEDSLPIKRGLSNSFTGRSKSFANLSEVNAVQDLQKDENPFNKRRRTLIAYKLSRKNSGFYSWQNPNSMPLLALKEEPNRENNSSEEEEIKEQKPHGRKLKTFKSTSCFSLTDL